MHLKDNKKRRNRAILSIWFVLIFYLITTGFEVLDVSHFNDINEEEFGILETCFYLAYAFFGFGYVAVFIISAITFIMWFRRVYFNLHKKKTWSFFF